MPRLRLRACPRLPAALTFSLASGVFTSLAFPPVGAWPVGLIAIMPLLWLLEQARPRRGSVLGLAFGVGFFGSTLYWMFDFGFAAWTALTLVSAASTALFGLGYPLVCRRGRPLLSALGAASLWTAVDRLRWAWPLGGFTWGNLGVSQVDDRALLRLASVTGVWGVTFAMILINALLLAGLTGGGARLRRSGRILVAATVFGAPLLIPFPAASGAPVRIATVQVDVRQARSAGDPVAEDLGVARFNIQADRTLAADPPDLVVWGEGALDPGAAADPATMADVATAVSQVGAPTLIGAVTDDADGHQRTDVLLFDASGALVDRYNKVHLVPFGEYVPWRHELSWFQALQQIPVDRAPGDRIHTLSTGDLPRFGTPICFENAFPEIPRAFVREGAQFLVVTVNNASYGFTAASAQHEQMSRMRAVETGRWVVNAAVSGISAFIDPSGRVTQRLGLFRTGILRGTIRSSSAMTLYVRFGDWVPYLAILLVLGLLLVPRRRRRILPAPEPLPSGARTLAVLPTYDERGTIEEVVRGVMAAPGSIDVIVVDDSSPDGTADAVRAMIDEFGSRLRLRERPAKSGLASAYLDGFALGLDEGYDLVVEMDSDLSHDPTELGSLLGAVDTADLVVGSRYIPGGAVTNWSRSRVALSRAGNRYARLMLGIPLHDATSGYRVYRRKALEALTAEPFRAGGYGFQIELVMRAWNLGYTVAESPITFRERTYGESKISRRIIVEALWLVTKWGIRDRLRGGGPSQPVSGVSPP
ncbi:MAG: apolipoprotein N-acyltransferase [Actinomycetota bacterium]|nr:apolipoprotein N-acyltransferase [Actinomycetota bacterium]